MGGKQLSESQILRISAYVDLLIHWNARINLTAIREPEKIVTRHFGESLFAARIMFPEVSSRENPPRIIDIGSGAGFPGLPIQIWNPLAEITLVEANHKKATFLREVIRALTLNGAEVFAGRAEELAARADVVTMRAVEKFHSVLPFALSRVKKNGRIVLLIGRSQLKSAYEVGVGVHWLNPLSIPLSSERIVLVGESRQIASL